MREMEPEEVAEVRMALTMEAEKLDTFLKLTPKKWAYERGEYRKREAIVKRLIGIFATGNRILLPFEEPKHLKLARRHADKKASEGGKGE